MLVTPDLLISRAAMVHNHWFVGLRLQSVTSIVRPTRGATAMATTPGDSEGTRSASSPMVAVPGAREAPVILGTGIGMAMPKMECKINLRGGNQDAWRRWLGSGQGRRGLVVTES